MYLYSALMVTVRFQVVYKEQNTRKVFNAARARTAAQIKVKVH